MRRRTFGFLQVALGLLTTSLVLPTGLLAQHGGFGAPMSSGHMGSGVHSSPSFSGSARSFAPPAAPLFHGPSHHPGYPGQQGHWPSWNQGRRPYTTRNGVGYRGPYLYGAYPGWLPFGYGLPLGLPFGDDEDEGSGAQVHRRSLTIVTSPRASMVRITVQRLPRILRHPSGPLTRGRSKPRRCMGSLPLL